MAIEPRARVYRVPSGPAVEGAPAVSVRGLGKQYVLGEDGGGMTTLKEAVTTALRRRLRGRGEAEATPSRAFWALRDVSFDVARGESLGIIGRNGSGKSTLLQILARADAPTEGQAEIRGRLGPLLAMGAGFNPEYSGRENVMMSAVMLGVPPRDVRKQMDEIIEFSGIGPFIDTPVKRYSSGMQVRLAFSVVAHIDADVILADEVLAVGDAEFRKKCFQRMATAVRRGKTLLFVSHSPEYVKRLCGRSIYLEGGRVLMDGDTDDVLERYNADIAELP